jgi:hypothetical protein
MYQQYTVTAAYIYIYENGMDAKRQFPFVCCKQKTELANFLLFAANENGKRKFVFIGSANKKRYSMIAVSANVPIYAVW